MPSQAGFALSNCCCWRGGWSCCSRPCFDVPVWPPCTLRFGNHVKSCRQAAGMAMHSAVPKCTPAGHACRTFWGSLAATCHTRCCAQLTPIAGDGSSSQWPRSSAAAAAALWLAVALLAPPQTQAAMAACSGNAWGLLVDLLALAGLSAGSTRHKCCLAVLHTCITGSTGGSPPP
jgi:hypothetical protein